ncbi:unnamed protein product [Caenorhabditis brenneri]
MLSQVQTTNQKGVIIKGMRRLDGGSFDFGMVWTKKGEFKLMSTPTICSTGVHCEVGQWVLVKENLRYRRVGTITRFCHNEMSGRIDEDMDFVVPYRVRLANIQFAESEAPGTRFYQNDFFQWIKIDQEFYETNENGEIDVYLKKLPLPTPIPGENYTYCHWVVKGFRGPKDSDVLKLEQKFTSFRVSRPALVPDSRQVERKNKKTSNTTRRPNPFAPVPIFWQPHPSTFSNSRAPGTSSSRPDHNAPLTPPATPSYQEDTPNVPQSSRPSPPQESHIDLPTSKAFVTTKTSRYLIIFLFKIRQPAILDLEFYRRGSKSIPDLKDEFTCRYKRIDEVIGLEFEVVAVTSYIKSFLDFKTVGMENHLLLPINLLSQEDRFQKFNGKFYIINSDGISDYVLIGEEVQDQSTELMPTAALLRKYKFDFAAREMIGACSLQRMEVPKIMVDPNVRDREAVALAWVWKLERVVAYREEWESYQNPRDTA